MVNQNNKLSALIYLDLKFTYVHESNFPENLGKQIKQTGSKGRRPLHWGWTNMESEKKNRAAVALAWGCEI